MCPRVLQVLSLFACVTRIFCASSVWTGQNEMEMSQNRYLIAPDHLLPYQNQGDEIEIFEGVKQRDMKGLVGETIQLPCQINMETCGELHSIKWYRGSSRIYVFSEMAAIARPEGDYAGRADLQYTANSSLSHLRLNQLRVEDEAVYKCEITYLEVREGCQVVQFINLITLIKPSSVRLFRTSLADENEMSNGSRVGPLSEDDQLTAICETEGGKPAPSVQWWNGTTQIHGDTEVDQHGGLAVARKRMAISVSRGDLSARYECRVLNDALDTPIVAHFELDVNVRPLSLNLSRVLASGSAAGDADRIVQGDRVELRCEVRGARPEATVTWYNGTQPLPANSTDRAIQTDGTFDTVSKLSFTATRYEDGGSLTCEAANQVMVSRNELPMRDNLRLVVMYPPIVHVYPDNKTVNESTNVTILCHYEANPSSLRSIKWYRNSDLVKHVSGSSGDRKLAAGDEDSVDGQDGTVFTVMNASRHDRGVYTCVLENEVGESTSRNEANISVYYVPTVNLTTDPVTPVSETEHKNITLMCEVSSGYPDSLLAVRWYLDGELLKELPECGGGGATTSNGNSSLCDIDPSRLLLEEVERRFHGNYSCAGMNEAGWGPVSTPTPVIVNYPPQGTRLTYFPTKVVKKKNVTLRCHVEDEGRPKSPSFRWLRGGHEIQGLTSATYFIPTVNLETESNFTCVARNEGGESEPATESIKVLAPPTFIDRPGSYFGARWNDQRINMTCRVECSPLCAISWARNGRPIERGARYDVREVVERPNAVRNHFESVRSTLVWNMDAWPNQQLDRLSDNANYSCISSGNIEGQGVISITNFGVEYPPENVTVTSGVVNVTEYNIPPRVLCSARAFPEASYNWTKSGETEVRRGGALILNEPLKRTGGGNYTCTAYNKHGYNEATTYFNVLYKPECVITQSDSGGKLVLRCETNANPAEVDFTWKVKNENETIEYNVEKHGVYSLLALETRAENFKTYQCFANNSVGTSNPCERDVTGNISWWHGLESDNLMILLAVIAGTILMVIIICIIIIIVCRRKRAADKCPNPSAIKDKSDLNSSPSDALLQTDPENKGFYENLPFHGMQNPPNKPFRPEFSDLDYADVDYRSYGPINYKAASIDNAQRRNLPQDDDEELL